MGKIILYHGSPDKEIKPAFGLGENRHDYGKGFYLTENIDLAKEWAVCRPDETNGWVHKYELDMEGLKVLDFQKYSILSWLAELMKHRDAADSKRYRMLSQKFIAKYGIETSGYDVIKGWRAKTGGCRTDRKELHKVWTCQCKSDLWGGTRGTYRASGSNSCIYRWKQWQFKGDINGFIPEKSAYACGSDGNYVRDGWGCFFYIK